MQYWQNKTQPQDKELTSRFSIEFDILLAQQMEYLVKSPYLMKLNRDRFSDLLIFLFVLFLPTQFGKHFFLPFSHISGVRVDYLAPTVYVTDIFALLLILTHLAEYRTMLRNKTIQVILFLLSLTLIFAFSRDFGLYKFLKVIELFAVGAIFMSRRVNKDTVFYGFFCAALIQCFIAVLQFVLRRSLGGEFYYLGERPLGLSMPGIAKAALDGVEMLRPYGTFSHPNSMAGFFLTLYATYIFNRPMVNRLFLWSFLILCAVLTIISFSKIAIGTFFFITLAYLLRHKQLGGNAQLRAVVVISVGFLCAIFFQASTDPLTISKRITLVYDATAIIAADAITGVGLGNYLYAQAQFPQMYPSFIMQPVHNIILLVFAEVGVLIGMYLIYVLTNNLRPLLKTTWIIPYVAILITGMFDHYWLTLQQNWLLLGVMWGLTMSRQVFRHSPDSAAAIRGIRRGRRRGRI